MSAVSSARHPIGSGCISGCLPAVLLALSMVLARPAMAGAQTPRLFPPLSFRQELDLEVLGSVTKDLTYAPSFRLTWRRRNTLHRSTILSGMLLLDPLSNSVGVTAGQMFSIPVRGTQLEPFAEVGAAYADARTLEMRYPVVDTSGGGLRWVRRYRAEREPAALAGAGVSWSGVLRGRGRVRLTLGYWELAGLHGLQDGRLRFGVSLGWAAGHDARWYSLASDKTPPTVIVAGQGAAPTDSVEVAGGVMHVLAADAVGIAGIAVDGANVRFGPADTISAHELGLGNNAVVGSAEVRLPLDGERLEVAVRDSAGLTTHAHVWAIPGPDHKPPTVSVRTPGVHTLIPPARARVDDLSGIAYARIGACPTRLIPGDYLPDSAPPHPTARLVQGWGAPDRHGAELEVWDRAGNVARASLPSWAPRIPADAKRPQLGELSATVGSREAGRMSVRIHGMVWDPAGGWIARVEVDGQPALLRLNDTPSAAVFDGWLVVPQEAKTVTVVATTLDGRSKRESVPITRGTREKSGRLYALLIFPTDTTHLSADLRALARRAGDDDPTILVGSAASPQAVFDAFTRLERQVGPGDAVLVHLQGTLTAGINALGPSVELGAGSLRLATVGALVRRLDAGATFVSTAFRPGRAWAVLPDEAPGAEPPVGCYGDDERPQGTVVDVGRSATQRILTGLAGAADRNGDGRILTTEMLSYLGVSLPPGLVPFDPLLTLKTAGGGR